MPKFSNFGSKTYHNNHDLFNKLLNEFEIFMCERYVGGNVPKCVGVSNVFHKEFLSDRSVAGRGDSIFATREEKENQVRFTRSEIKNQTV